MPSSPVPPDVAAFVAAASRLPLTALQEIRHATAVAVASGAFDHAVVPKFDAARFSALDKLVRDSFHPRAEELRAARPGGGLRSAISRTTTAAQAIWKRDRLSAEAYAMLTGAFPAYGVSVPDHPDHEAG
ncbi:hypothetical protein [Streptomyces sp. NRRL F-5727]|uniref:hypothetical protein n=1 Tax=Streptomyces sp. NRRL F-5727 TaxID=1463871 RepID=UPI0004C9EF92|nr:hypothetical protein [Streptomyces sp. NRRL F-5727]